MEVCVQLSAILGLNNGDLIHRPSLNVAEVLQHQQLNLADIPMTNGLIFTVVVSI